MINLNTIKSLFNEQVLNFANRQFAKLVPSTKLVGITGTFGKTTTLLALKSILSQKETVVTTEDFNSVSDPFKKITQVLLKTNSKVDRAILELTLQKAGDAKTYLNFFLPNMLIVTRLADQTSEQLINLDEVIREISYFLENMPEEGTVILNWEDSLTHKLADKTKAKVLFYGLDKENSHVFLEDIKINNFQTKFELNYGVERVEITTPLLGLSQIYLLAGAATLAINLGYSLISIKKGLEKLEPGEHKLETLAGYNDTIILDDTYNNHPVSLEEAINTLNLLTARRRIVVLSEMKDVSNLENAHRTVARQIYKEKIDLVFLGGGEAKIIEDELLKLGYSPEKIASNLTNPQIVTTLLKMLSRGDAILVKGHKSARLDEVIKKLSKVKR